MTALLTATQVGQIGRLTSARVVLLALAISGCGGSYWSWTKPGVSEQQMRQDGFECKQISRQQYIVGTGGMLMGGSEPNFEIWKECLEARGYTVWEQKEQPQVSFDAVEASERVRANERAREQEWALRAEKVQKEYQYLKAEKNRLDQQKVSLDKEPDSVEHRQTVAKYNRQVAEYQARLKAYEELLRKPF